MLMKHFNGEEEEKNRVLLIAQNNLLLKKLLSIFHNDFQLKKGFFSVS